MADGRDRNKAIRVQKTIAALGARGVSFKCPLIIHRQHHSVKNGSAIHIEGILG